MFLSVVIPAYNEEKRITKTLESVKRYFKDKDYAFEVLVSDDGSKDNTVEIVKDFAKEFPELKVLDHKRNHGKGYVVRKGMLTAKGKYRLFMDADNSTKIDELDDMLPYLDEGFDIIIASVSIKGSTVAHTEKVYKRLFGYLSNLIIQIVLLPGIHDTQRGFKVFTAKATEDIFKKMKLDRWGFDFEILALARKMGYKIKEAPITWRNDGESKVKLSAYAKTLTELFKVRWWLWTGEYK